MPMDLKSSKKLLRKQFLEKRAALGREERAAFDEAIRRKIRDLEEFRKAKTVAGYATDGTEPDVLPLLREALELGKRACLPKWNGTEYILSFVTANDIDRLKPGKWGLPEPVATDPRDPVTPGPGLLILVPGTAFDDSLVRLGRGGGIYDRFLAAGGRSFALGVFYECQKSVLTLPAEPHDAPLDAAVTEQRVRRRIT